LEDNGANSELAGDLGCRPRGEPGAGLTPAAVRRNGRRGTSSADHLGPRGGLDNALAGPLEILGQAHEPV
jgi:hypothetical protein